jgi:hypothetical protein
MCCIIGFEHRLDGEMAKARGKNERTTYARTGQTGQQTSPNRPSLAWEYGVGCPKG